MFLKGQIIKNKITGLQVKVESDLETMVTGYTISLNGKVDCNLLTFPKDNMEAHE